MQAEDRSWFEPLVHRLGRPALRFAFMQVQDIELANDLVQEAFARVWASPRTPRDEADFRRWLYRAITNLALDQHRQRQRFARLPIPVARHADPLEVVDQRAGDESLMAALMTLSVRERQAVYLRYFEDRSVAETARLLGMNPVTLRVLMHRSLAKLRRALGREMPREVAV